MESNNQSCEKLVTVEAGLPSLRKPSDSPFIGIPYRYKSSKKCTSSALVLLATVLLVTISWQIWQMVRNEQIMKEIEAQNLESEKREMPLVQEDPRIQKMTEELKKLQDTLTDVQKKIDQRDQIPTTTELPMTTSGRLIPDEITEYGSGRWLQRILENNDDAIVLNSNSIFTEFPITEQDIGQDDKLDGLVPIQVIKPIDESSSAFHWTFRFGSGGRAGDEDKSGESNVSENDESEEAASAEVEPASSEEGWISYVPRMLISPFTKTWAITWRWYSPDVEDSEDSGSEEETLDGVSSEEAQTIQTTEIPASEKVLPVSWRLANLFAEESEVSESSEETKEEIGSEEAEAIRSTEVPAYDYTMYDDIYADLESYDGSYEYSDSSKDKFYDADGDDAEVLASSSTENAIKDTIATENPIAESSSNPDLSGASFESETTEAAPIHSSSVTKIYNFFSDDDNPDGSTDFYGLGSVADHLPRSLGNGPAPNSDDDEDSSTSSSIGDRQFLTKGDKEGELIEEYFRKLLKQRLAEVKLLDQLYARHLADDGYIHDESKVDSYTNDDDSVELFGQSPSTSTSREWSYISKRSADTPLALERLSGKLLSSKELERKMVILQRSIDNHNHFLQNEVSLTPQPTQRYLKEKLNRFYAKMEAVSAHIDLLHERFLRMHKLDDDYVSREFPSEDADADGISEQ